jgi:hypothetical protein
VVEDVPHGHGLLAMGAELRPEVYYRGVISEEAALRQDVRHRRGGALDD